MDLTAQVFTEYASPSELRAGTISDAAAQPLEANMSRAVKSRPLRMQLVNACDAVGECCITDCHKGNVVRLRQMVEKLENVLYSGGVIPFEAFEAVNDMLARCEDRFREALEIMPHEQFETEQIRELHQRFSYRAARTREDMRREALSAFERSKRARRPRANALLFACPPLGLLGLHHFYLGSPVFGIISIATCWTVIVPLLNLAFFFQLMLTDDLHFDLRFNPDYVYFKSLSKVV